MTPTWRRVIGDARSGQRIAGRLATEQIKPDGTIRSRSRRSRTAFLYLVEIAMSAACPLFGFVVQLGTLDVRMQAQLLAALRRELLEQRGLVVTDGEAPDTHIVTGDGFQATDADREAVIEWLAAQTTLAGGYTVGALDDVGRAA